MIPKGAKQHPKSTNYYITKDGKVWSKRRSTTKGGWLKAGSHTQGYKMVTISQEGKDNTKFVHRLVLETYIGLCPEGMECRHLDGDVTNNNLFNLQWGTHTENMKDSLRQGRLVGINEGVKNGQARLTEEAVRMIVYMHKTGLFTQRKLAKLYKISAVEVNRIIKRKRWQHIWSSKL